ncbi:MAG: hypothetical protein ISS31_04310 [Kiritimatiellae bacterium]|nr:hypothetical protein [Kiritimatiellia bacterium]
MRKLQLWGSALFLITAVALSPLFVGCEDEPGGANVNSFFAQNDTENQEREGGTIPLSLEPPSGTISVAGQRIAFRAKGAVLPVRWSPASRAAGTITIVGPRSDYAVFKAASASPNTVLAVDAAGRTVTAAIGVGGGSSLQIAPDSASILDGITVQFIAAGGSQPYVSWTAAFPAMGSVSPTGLYTPEGILTATPYLNGTNLITVTDSAGDVTTAEVIHQ